MKTLTAFTAILLLMAIPAIAQEPSVVVHATPPVAAEVTGIDLSGPDKATTGEVVTLYLTGTPPVDLTKPLVDQLSWLMGSDAMSAHLLAPGQPMAPLDVEGTIVFAASGATLRPQVRFTAGVAGEYRVVVDWNSGQNQLVERVVAVEGDSPDPFPQPQPLPDGIRVVMVLSESSDRTPQEVAEVTALRRQLSSLPTPPHFQLLDPDTPSVNNWAEPLKAEIAKRQIALPVLAAFVLPTSGDPVVVAGVEPLPATAAESMVFAKEALGL